MRMTAINRTRTRATERTRRARFELGYELRQARVGAGLSQTVVGRSLGWSATKVSRIEAARLASLSLDDAGLAAAAVGLDLTIRTFPGGEAVRDQSQSQRLMSFLANVGAPLTWRTEVPLRRDANEWREQRAWDALIEGLGERTAIEHESRLHDVQELTRRHNRKRRDDPVNHFLLLVADTRHNRRVLDEFDEMFVGLPRLRTANVVTQLRAGRHPPTGIILI